ncbi:MAG: hypothetical protein N2Z73_04005, partial [Endomicrobia bacterium]|nr:hypothetical protein [Endomicrobiia bacterium]
YIVYMATYAFNNKTDFNVVEATTVIYPLTSVTISGLKNGTTYYFRFLTVDKGDTGDGYFGEVLISTYLSVLVSAVPKVQPPQYLQAKHYGNKIELSWQHSPEYEEDNFAGYRIYRSTVGHYYEVPQTYHFVAQVGKLTDYTDTTNIQKHTIYYYILRSVDTDGIESEISNLAVAIPDFVPPKFVYVSKPSTRYLAKPILQIELQVVDDKFEVGDRQGKLIFIDGKYRKIGDITEYNLVKFYPPLQQGVSEYKGVAEFDIKILNLANEGIEYQFIARDEVNTTIYPKEGWEQILPPKDLPEQKFITPNNPEVVFGKEVDEVVIRDYYGNEIWKEKSDGVNLLIWRGKDKNGKELESGAYIYQLKTKDGKIKYGVIIVVK